MMRKAYFGVAVVIAVFVGQAVLGITWGLPSRSADPFLFPSGDAWSGEKIFRLAHAGERSEGSRGADVDVDPLNKSSDQPIPLTATEADVARILLRYRLYTYQPDEMIAMMALARMNPGRLDLDPRLYQYGGLFIYPLGALIKTCGMIGWIDVRGDLVYYLDHPDEFGKFYVVARAYSAAWGLLGVLVVYLIANRIASFRTPSASAGPDVRPVACAPGSDTAQRCGLLAALFFTLMPVVVCMSHEGKPHLPGAVLMLLAVYYAMRVLDPRRLETAATPVKAAATKLFCCMCVLCGAAVGMVLSSGPICVLIPLVASRAAGFRPRARIVRAVQGLLIAIVIYLTTNPYVLINAFIHRDVLRSNFGNSLTMYEVTQIGEGFLRVVELSVEGATLPVVLMGAVGLAFAVNECRQAALPLAAAALLFFLQFVLIGAGKPAEYGRFGVFSNAALAIGGAYALRRLTEYRRRLGHVAAILVILVVASRGLAYLDNFRTDATGGASRLRASHAVAQDQLGSARINLLAEPAPYGCPPLPFASRSFLLGRSADPTGVSLRPLDSAPLQAFDKPSDARAPGVARWRNRIEAFGRWWMQTPISWANKPFEVRRNDQTLLP